MGKYIEVQVSRLIEGHKTELVKALKHTTGQDITSQEALIVRARDIQTVQKTLTGASVSDIPKVRTTDGHLVDWDRNAVVSQLLKETKLSESFYSKPAITLEEAKEIAREVETRIKDMGLQFLSGPLVRELVNIVLLEKGHTEWRNLSTRVGTPVYDAYRIDMGTGFEAKDNANLQENAETSHKKKADKMSKEQYLLMIPPGLADAHLNGDIHIHDLEYLGTRAFCQDWDLRYFFYYGLMPDGSGTKASVAGPARKAEVAILHAVKALGSAQTNFAGGQGFYNFLTFIA
ncbi:MAG: anaerobic ribonucleoside-triphosphate reductase, partial [Candidatus Methanoperedenaceae archaeon]|nr:anaerobic ribonucleoside-triphosphate reductase [Candidatus Methanoperedenaceae archaeon]